MRLLVGYGHVIFGAMAYPRTPGNLTVLAFGDANRIMENVKASLLHA